ncbi:MAG TPA: YajQ family cyclic di-GMP-binding protein [Candidatus Dormibacteraeota bacterium]|jgi:hypothetical protein|nr:YajQ family cyclic di-GMP-binding protein [Candidatus Dormibacteraeota bacterium]
MAQDFSFDVVSDYDHQELVNALDQARREVGQRYDFKNVTAEITEEKEKLVLLAGSDMHLRAMLDIIKTRLHKRGIDLKVLDPQKAEPAARGNVRQEVKLRKGIAEDLARDLNKKIRAGHPKVQVRIEGDKLRVSAKAKDNLQAVIQDLRDMELDVPLQFVNYR